MGARIMSLLRRCTKRKGGCLRKEVDILACKQENSGRRRETVSFYVIHAAYTCIGEVRVDDLLAGLDKEEEE